MIHTLRSWLFTIIFYTGSAVVALAILAGAFSKRWIIAGAHLWSAWFVWCARVLLGIRLQVRGAIPSQPAIVAFKHQSMFETILTLYLFRRPAVVMKRELRSIPVWGYLAFQHGSIFVERNRAGAALRNLIRDARDRVTHGRQILIFPEGTRVPVGEAPPLKGGLSGLYAILDLPIVPVTHDAGRLWGKGLVKRAGTVTLAFGPDIPPGLSREAMEAKVHAAINADPTSCAVREAPPTAAAAPARRSWLAPWMVLLPLGLGGLLWFWLWHGYSSGLRTELGRWLSPPSTIETSGFPYRLEADIANARLSRESAALALHLQAQTAIVNRIPWEKNRQVIAAVEPRLSLAAKHLAGASLGIHAPYARASLRTEKGRIARLSIVWTKPAMTSGLFATRATASQLETHLRETPTFGNIGPSPTGPVQAEVEISGQQLRLGGSAPLALELAAAVTADAPLVSFGQWANGGTIEISHATLSDNSGDIATLKATIVPDGLGGLRIAGTIDTVCPQSVRAALGDLPAVSERRLRRPARIAFSGTLPGSVSASPADATATSLPVRAQLPPCPVLG